MGNLNKCKCGLWSCTKEKEVCERTYQSRFERQRQRWDNNMKVSRTDNHSVALNWKEGNPSKSWTTNFSTDGNYLFSYNLMIGYTNPSGVKVSLEYNAPNHNFVSMTTSSHVSLANNVSDCSECVFGQRITKPDCWSSL